MSPNSVETHLVTGATGFVGSALVLELLGRTDAEIACVVRGSAEAAPQERLRSALRQAAAGYGLDGLFETIEERCVALEGDLLQPLCGVKPGRIGPVAKLWHCAASLQYEDKHKEAILAANLDGTRHALELARALGNPDFLYVSTAYVAGDRTGQIEEAPVVPGTTHNNWYERSKVEAERLVRDGGLPAWKILRPSIVIGHSRTYSAASFTGLYGFIRGFNRFDAQISEELGSFLKFRPLRFLADPDCLMNFIPVDAAAEAIARIGLEDDRSGLHYHVASRSGVPLREVLELACSMLGLAPPTYIESESDFSSIDQAMHDEVRFYRSYANNSKVFETSNSVAVIGEELLDWRLPPDRLRSYVEWYVERLHGSDSRSEPVVAAGVR